MRNPTLNPIRRSGDSDNDLAGDLANRLGVDRREILSAIVLVRSGRIDIINAVLERRITLAAAREMLRRTHPP
jgi:hypothetical protein